LVRRASKVSAPRAFPGDEVASGDDTGVAVFVGGVVVVVLPMQLEWSFVVSG